MQFSFRALGVVAVLGVAALGSEACYNTIGVAEVFMSPDSDEDGRRWTVFPPASTSINCIARVATGRKDVTMQGKIVEYPNFDPNTGLPTGPAIRTAGNIIFHPTASTKLQTLAVTLSATNPNTGEQAPFPKGAFQCQIFADDGTGKFNDPPLRVTNFLINYLPCPDEGVATGEACADIYGPGITKGCYVAGATSLCTCDAKLGWQCAGGGGFKVGGGTTVTGKDAGSSNDAS